jgi:hypothetical protein
MARFGGFALAAIVVASAVTACSSGSSTDNGRADAPRVATLASPDRVAPPTADPEIARPRHRLDESEADEAVLRRPYENCMAQHGQAEFGKKGMGEGDSLPPALKKAQDACVKYWPLPPWELDPANPGAKDFARAVVQCLKSKGIDDVHVGENGINVVAGDKAVTAVGEHLHECQEQTAKTD